MKKSYFYFLLSISATSVTFAAEADDLLTATTSNFTSAVAQGRNGDAKEALGIIQLLAQEGNPTAGE